MALSRTSHGLHLHDNTGFVPQGTGPFATGNFTPADNSLLVAAVLAGTDSPASESSYVTTGGGWTWTKRVSETITYSGDGFIHQIWTAPVTTGASMAVTSTHTSINSYAFGIAVFAYTGYDTSTPTGGFASGSDATGTNSLTLSEAPASDDEVIAFITVVANADGTGASATPGSSFVELFENFSQDSFASWQGQSRTASTSDAVSWTTTTAGSSPFDQRIYSALTIKAAAAGGGGDRAVGSGLTEGRLLQRTRLFKGPRTFSGWRAQRGLLVPERLAA